MSRRPSAPLAASASPVRVRATKPGLQHTGITHVERQRERTRSATVSRWAPPPLVSAPPVPTVKEDAGLAAPEEVLERALARSSEMDVNRGDDREIVSTGLLPVLVGSSVGTRGRV